MFSSVWSECWVHINGVLQYSVCLCVVQRSRKTTSTPRKSQPPQTSHCCTRSSNALADGCKLRVFVCLESDLCAKANLSLCCRPLECLAVNGPMTVLVVLLLGYPHFLERVQRGKNRAAHPRRVKSLLRCRDLRDDCNVQQME